MVIADTSFLIALLIESDSSHIKAIEQFQYLNEDDQLIYINKYVISEIVTLANSRLKKYSKNFQMFIDLVVSRKSENFVLYEGDYGFEEIIAFAFKFKLSFVDSTLLYLKQNGMISEILSFDRDLLKVVKNAK